MSFQKGNKVDVEKFSFSQLTPTQGNPGEITEYELEALNPAHDFKKKLSEDIIRLERKHEHSSGFNIDEHVREHRGLRDQENSDFESRVEEEVERRLNKKMKQAYEEGFTSGAEDGSKKAFDELAIQYEEKILVFEEFLITMMEQKEAILVESKQEAYALVKNLTKWIILKEVQDKEYVERLLEKLILEINTKSNLLIRINEEDFADLPGVIEKVESRLGALTNIRIEIGHDMVDRGIILESEVGVVDGSFKSQMKSLDKLFENVGIMEKASDD
jgi:flagellar assembly protein FliH